MIAELSKKYASYLLIVGMLLMIYIAYQLSFSRAFQSLMLNYKLNNEKSAGQRPRATVPQLERQHHFYVNALKGYRVKSEGYETRLWQAISEIAVNKGLSIGLVPAQQQTDTLSGKSGMVFQQYKLKGNYINMVRFLDSIGKTKGIGKVADLKLGADKSETDGNNTKELALQLTMVALVK